MFLVLCFAVVCIADETKRVPEAVVIHVLIDHGKYSGEAISLVNIRGGMDYILNAYDKLKICYGRIVDGSGVPLGYFMAIPFIMVTCYDNFNPEAKDRGGCYRENVGEFDFKVPKIPGGKKVEFFDQKGKKILIIDISSVGK